MRPDAYAGGSGDSSDDQDSFDTPGYNPMDEGDEEPAGATELDLPDEGPENAVGGQGMDYAEDDDNAPNVGEAFFEDGLFEDTDVPGEVNTDAGTFYGIEEDGDVADIETGPDQHTILPDTPSSAETGDAKMENAIIARKQVEESIVERLIREMQSYQDSSGSVIKESFDDLDDMSLEDMF
jgi:hypothetical protein